MLSSLCWFSSNKKKNTKKYNFREDHFSEKKVSFVFSKIVLLNTFLKNQTGSCYVTFSKQESFLSLFFNLPLLKHFFVNYFDGVSSS